jgi:prepilin-type N-terminal cleavage/methylation domain-containing protein
MRAEKKGFTLAELAIVLVVVGLLIGGVIKGAQIVRQAKAKRQAEDLKDLAVSCELVFDRTGRLPGDWDGDGEFDDNESVWMELQDHELVSWDLRSPYGGEYYFDYGWYAGKEGNYVSVEIPGYIAGYVDQKIDDGDPWQGTVRCEDGYWYDEKVEVVHYIFMD